MDEAHELYEEARRLMASDKLHEAVQSFEHSATLVPHFKTLELLGECLLRLGRPADAIVPLAAATSLNRQGRAAALLSQAFYEIGEHEQAREFALEALQRAPGNRIARSVIRKLEA